MPAPIHKPCLCCGKIITASLGVKYGAIRPAVQILVQRDHPEANPDQMVCWDCMNRYRSEYVMNGLAEDRGRLSDLELEVGRKFREREAQAIDVNREFDRHQTFGQRIADRVAEFGGSWTFILTMVGSMTCWIIWNLTMPRAFRFDETPFMLFNLLLSCMAALQAPVIMMSQNRQSDKDRLQARNDYQINLRAELEIQQLQEKLDFLRHQQWDKLIELQEIQLELMQDLFRSTARK